MASSSTSLPSSGEQSIKTRQQTSSRMMKTTKRGRPYAKDIHDLFSTLIVSLQLSTHRSFLKSYPNTFTTDEAAENLAALKFSQSNRAPDPNEPTRVITTTTTTTFSMNRDMAKGICQHFMDARLIENAVDRDSEIFKDRGIYALTAKGLHILERFITKNGINGEHLLKVFSSQPICMKLLHLERRTHDDELVLNRGVLEVIFRRFIGRQPNYPPSVRPGDSGNSGAGASSSAAGGADGELDRTMGIEVTDIIEKRSKGAIVTIRHCFGAIAALDWLCDFTTICGKDEAAEIAAHFVRLGFVDIAQDRSRPEELTNVLVAGEDVYGKVTEGEFRCHYKVMYGLTDKGRAAARWPGYLAPSNEANQVQSFQSRDAAEEIMRGSSPMPGGDDGRSARSRSLQDSASGIPSASGHTSDDASGYSNIGRRPSAAERFRNDYMARSQGGRSGAQSPVPGSEATHSVGGGGGGSSISGGGTYNSRDSNTNRLKQILEEPALRSLFREFLKANFCEENLSFWLDVQDFKRRFHTTSSAVAVRTTTEEKGGKGDGKSSGGGIAAGLGRKLRGTGSGSSSAANASSSVAAVGGGKGGSNPGQTGYGFTAMEKHQQDLIAMAFVIYNTYLAPASPCELNIEHNLRSELVAYMTKVLSDARGPDGSGLAKVSATEVRNAAGVGSPSGGGGGSVPSGLTSPSTTPAGAVPGANSTRIAGQPSLEERRAAVSASMPKAPLHASQLQTMVRLYEKIQDHIFRLMATDSVPRFIKAPAFQSLVEQVEEYAEALESGRVDPKINSGPAIGKHVVDAMELRNAGTGSGTGTGTGMGTGTGSGAGAGAGTAMGLAR